MCYTVWSCIWEMWTCNCDKVVNVRYKVTNVRYEKKKQFWHKISITGYEEAAGMNMKLQLWYEVTFVRNSQKCDIESHKWYEYEVVIAVYEIAHLK